MVRKGKGKFFNKPRSQRGKKYHRFFLSIPTEVATDTSFLFRDGDIVEVEIVKDGLMVREKK